MDIAHPDSQYRTEDDDEMEAAALAQVKANLAGGKVRSRAWNGVSFFGERH